MPALHSTFLNSSKFTSELCGLAKLPCKRSKEPIEEPASVSDLPAFSNIVDEAIYLFRANIFFRNFEIKGPADRTLLYALLFLQDVLGQMKQQWSRKEAEKSLLITASTPTFPIPGDKSFCLTLANIFPSPANKNEADALREYLTELRVELVHGLLDRLYKESLTVPDKWWLSFSKRKFMNKTL